MKDGIPFGLLLIVGAIGYYIGKKIGRYEAAMTVIEQHLRTGKKEV
jgi:hypothetical protein